MMMMVHHDNHRRPFSSSERGEADGPTCNRPPVTDNYPNNNSVYDVVVAAAAGSSSSGGQVLRGLQPFDISNRTTNTCISAHHTAFRSPAGGMTTSLGFPFTNTQWKELERQAMIYKYMVASLPVPRDLLFPITRAPSGPTISQSPLSGGFNLRLSNSTDPEPGRCKRTDGKKWRCSRDVAPDQKYCERHMHRGRPRSRKHVEVHANTTTKRVRHDINQAHPTMSPATASISNTTSINKNVCQTQFIGSNLQPYHQSPMFLDRDTVKAATFDSMNSASSDREHRSLNWLMMKGEPVQMATSDPQWQHLMQSKTELNSKIPFFDANSSIFTQRSEEECFLNLNSYTNFNAGGEDQPDNECNMFLNPDVVSLDNPLLEETPRCFIDAWSKTVIDEDTMANSVNNKDNSSAPSSGQLSPSSLTLSMGGYNSINEEMGQTQMSLGNNGNDMKPGLSTWLSPASWVASAPGGPLAEVLKPTTSAASNPSSPITAVTANGELGSPLATTVSSPSGVLQKTFASLSDSSGNSSPTLASSRAKQPEIVSLWLNQNKA
ncbi:growth-regulating factor 7 isoform X1 [Prunus avium]|uniref:Growth-regulating factor n=1 Tax=Prunus avium TaxID=42229 RepID=A0A6P5RUU2_PRUAV|nr:growth-regulating factor 7 isoform X1 [Prunus avium]